MAAEILEGQMTLMPLPDIAGYVHGIVQVEPVKIQCDGCGYIHEGEPGKAAVAIITCGIQFHALRYERGDRRRLCKTCRKIEWGLGDRDH